MLFSFIYCNYRVLELVQYAIRYSISYSYALCLVDVFIYIDLRHKIIINH